MDFVHDQSATGQKIRVLTVVDTFSRFSPAIRERRFRKIEPAAKFDLRLSRHSRLFPLLLSH
jgi:hypothetical protein